MWLSVSYRPEGVVYTVSNTQHETQHVVGVNYLIAQTSGYRAAWFWALKLILDLEDTSSQKQSRLKAVLGAALEPLIILHDLHRTCGCTKLNFAQGSPFSGPTTFLWTVVSCRLFNKFFHTETHTPHPKQRLAAAHTEHTVLQVQPGHFLRFSWVIIPGSKCDSLTLKNCQPTCHSSGRVSRDTSARPVSDSGLEHSGLKADAVMRCQHHGSVGLFETSHGRWWMSTRIARRRSSLRAACKDAGRCSTEVFPSDWDVEMDVVQHRQRLGVARSCKNNSPLPTQSLIYL